MIYPLTYKIHNSAPKSERYYLLDFGIILCGYSVVPRHFITLLRRMKIHPA